MTSTRARLVGILLLVWLASPALRVAHAQAGGASSSERTYQAAIDEAVRALRGHDLAGAEASFQRAHALQPSARTLRGLAAVALEAERYAEADRLLRAALADSRKPLTPEQRKEAEQTLTRLKVEVARVFVLTSPDDAVLTIDGAPVVREPDGALVLTPGTHALGVSAPGHLPHEERIALAGGSVLTLRPMLRAVVSEPPVAASVAPIVTPNEDAPVPPPTGETSPRRRWAWPTIGVASAIAGGGVALLALARREAARVEDAASGSHWTARHERAQTRAPRYLAAGVALGAVGLSGLALGSWLLWKGERRDAQVGLSVAPRGASLGGVF